MPGLLRIAPELPVAEVRASIACYEAGGARVAGVGIHVFTEGLDALFVELQQRGAIVKQAIVRRPWGNRNFRVTGESGNELKFAEPLNGD